MKNINSNIKFLYLLVICSSFINFLGVIDIIPMIKILNVIIWFIIFIIGIFITKNDYNHFYNVKDKISTLIIILLIFFMLYFSLGLIFGFSYNVYNNSNINMVLRNLLYYIIPLIFQEYIRGILCNYSNNNKYLFLFITFIFISINFNYFAVNSMFSSGEMFFKFLCINLFPLIAVELVMTYLCTVGGYKLSLIYKILFSLYTIYLPIIPNINFFLNGIILIFLPSIIYFVIDNYHEKEIKHVYVDYKNNIILECMPIFIVVLLFVFNMFGIFKYQVISIMSDSMNPLYEKGDGVVIKKLSSAEKEQLKVGDIIAYYDSNGILIIHRIKSINTEDDNISFITKGDNNEEIDSKRVKLEDIKGKYLFKIKYIGYPRYIINDLLNG